MLKKEEDAFGQEIMAYHQDPTADVREIIERDDGFVDISGGPAAYFLPFEEWPPVEKEAMQYVTGRVLDVGCGAGRVCLHLQSQGHEVVGVDNSPLAIQVCRERGVKDARVVSITRASANRLGTFDTIVMLGNNFGLFGGYRRAKWLLRRFYHMTRKDGRIVAATNDIYKTDAPEHLAYHERNRQRGRMPGRIRFRVLHRMAKGPWMDYLMVSPAEMDDILDGTGWQVAQRIHAERGGLYVAVIEKV